MTVNDFLNKCEESFPGKPYTTGQRAAFVQKLTRFSDEEILRIYEHVLEQCKYSPKIADVYDAARSLGYFSAETTGPVHHWKPSDCPSCNGEGRIAIFWEFVTEDRENGRVEVQQLAKVLQYTKSFDYRMPANQFRSVFRCKCSAGDATSLPKAWPKLTRQTQTRREVWL